MALVFLFLSFFFAIWGVWEFFSVYFSSDNPSQIMIAAMTGMAITVIPYLLGKSLSEMIAIRQRHLMLEQSSLQQQMMIEAMGEVALEMEEEEKAASTTAAGKTVGAPASPTTPPPSE